MLHELVVQYSTLSIFGISTYFLSCFRQPVFLNVDDQSVVTIWPRSFCERCGSYLHDLFDADGRTPPNRAVHRLHLRESRVQCVGSQRDKAIVAEIVRCLLVDLGKKPIISKPA